MSKKIVIAVIFIIAIGGAFYFFTRKDALVAPVKISVEATDKSCLSDSDCVAISNDCSSAACGQAVNRFSLSKYEKDGIKVCPSYAQTSACEISTPKCLAGVCILSLPKVDPRIPSFTIRQINRASLPLGTYNIEGYVYNIYECPACPTGKFCATCLAPHIVLMQDQGDPRLRKNQMLETQIIIRVSDSSEFIRTNKYRFTISIPEGYKFDETYQTGYDQEVKMIAYEPLDL